MNKAAMGARLREARTKKNFTQEQLAKRVNKVTTYISDIERGVKSPSLNLFIEIVDVLDISSDYILRDEIEAGKQYIYDEITKKLGTLTPKQRLAVVDLINVYLNQITM